MYHSYVITYRPQASEHFQRTAGSLLSAVQNAVIVCCELYVA